MDFLQIRGFKILIKVCLLSIFYWSNSVSVSAQNTTTSGTPQNNNNLPVGNTQQINPPNNKVQEGILPLTTATSPRAVTLEEPDAAAIANEEKIRLQRAAELEANEAKATMIRRTFGSSLFTNNRFDMAQAINIATPNNYVLGPGDKLEIVVYGYSQHTQTNTVNPDGYIILEKSGIVAVNGLTLESAESKIKTALSRTYPGINAGNTYVKVALTGFRTIKIRITGEVVAPGTYTLTSFSSLMTALYACGGPNEIGTYRDIALIRGNREIVRLDLYDILIKGYSNADILLKDQDVIYVGPFINRVAISGFTKRTGLFEVKPGEKISNLLQFAGGFNQYAYSDLLKIYRNTASERKIINIEKVNFEKEPVHMGDSLVIEKVLERYDNMVKIEGAVFRAGEYSLDTNPTLTKLIDAAAGLKEESLQGRINIVRTNPDLSTSNISVNYFDIIEGKEKDWPLKKNDFVFVPSIFELTEQSTIRIQGAINNPAAKEGVELPFVKDMTIQDVLVRVGGLTEAASLSRIEIVRRKRNIDPKQSDAQIADIIHFNMRPDLSLVEGQESITLMPFDEIIVRTSPNYEKQKFVTISGEVLYPGKYAIEYKDEKIASIIDKAGGLTDLAYVKGATLSRKTLLSERQRLKREEALASLNIKNKVKVTQGLTEVEEETKTTEGEEADSYISEDIGIQLEKILAKVNNSNEDIILQDGDEVVIPKKLETVRIEGEILYPTSVKYSSDKVFLDYISAAGGFTKKSSKGSSYIRYPNGSVDRTRKFLFMRFHPKVEPGSEIVIPAKSETTTEQFAQFSGLVATISGTLATIVTIIGLIRLNK